MFSGLMEGVSYPTIAGILLFASILVVAIRRRYFSSISDIPGPFLASFSVLWEVWSIIGGRIEFKTIALHEKLGYFVRISHNEVSVSHPEGIRKILLNPIRKADWYKVMALPDHRFQTPMSEVDPKIRVERARNVAAAYSLSHIIKFEPYVDGAISLLSKRLGELAAGGKPVEFDKWFNYMAFDVIGEVTFSNAFGFLESGKDLGGSIANSRVLTLYVTIAGFFYSLHKHTLGNPIVNKLNLMPQQHIFDTTKRAIQIRQKNPDVRNDMLSVWLQQLKEYPDRFKENDMYGVVNATVGAGADTVSASLQAFFYYMLRSPASFQRCREEIDEAQTEKDRPVPYNVARQLPYLQACLKETWRLHTPVALGLARVVPKEGLTIGGRFFEPGTKLSIHQWVIHRSKEFFGEDASEFNPSRWLEPRGQAMEQYYIPFGAGYNSCPGRNLAMLEVSKAASTLVRDFDIRQVDPKQSWTYECHFTAVPYGWPCYVTRRETS
ncbi:benzoate 4-monooxygenase cytochrome P450 [Lophium mytilinum]|uniref:Benzoate 4-monooxygenase cytochrome P450 n=1 Tax=Lophium mytilinum TaxID=390894 RepID=A0A6A6QZH7_9PEZI|nr:benzoate 4-monooxygenase cytochrome P450 [Lophium mytilinum]